MINEDIPGVEVAVQVDGADVNEFDAPDAGDEDEASATLTKYIECVDDAFFTIRVRMGDYDWDEVPHCLHTSIFVDGQWIAGRIFRPGGMPVAQIKGREDHCVGEGWVLRKLRFAAVKTVDDARKDRVEHDAKVAKDLGLIEVRVYRGIAGRQMVAALPTNGGIEHKNFELAEKSLKGKAVSHGTSFASAERVSPRRLVDFRNLPDDGGPIANFRFLYRSRDALKREMIIPRSPTPPPPAFAALSAEDLRRLAMERFEQLRNGNVKVENDRPVKRERFEVLDSIDNASPKKHRKGKMMRLATGRRVEVVDLSSDDDDG